jgi:hypothetical protein
MAQANPFELLQVLTEHHVPFVVVGGHAVYFHGHKRLTEDTDVIWLRNPQSEIALLAALQQVNACWLSNERDPNTDLERAVPVSSAYIRCEHLMMLWTDHGFLDLFDYLPGDPKQDVQQVYDESLLADGIRYVSLPWLIKMKRAAGRSKDLDDIRNLEDLESGA